MIYGWIMFYFVGIKGSGMSAMAVLLKELGYEVKGSDIEDYVFTQDNLKEKCIDVLSYCIDNLKEEYVYILQCENDSIEAEYVKNNFKYYYYHEYLSTLCSSFNSIAISGTHGKTTTTSMISYLFPNANSLIGNSYAHGNPKSSLFIFEACEYKDHFLNYFPSINIILNVDEDHIDYFKSKDRIVESFYQFSKQSNLCIFNGDDIALEGISFGYDEDNDYVIKDNKIIHNNLEYEINIPFLSKGMAYDICAAFIVSEIYGIDFNKRIEGFKMPKRRFNEFMAYDNIFIDDYAHHPREIENVIEMCKSKYKKKPIIIFEPHQYSRLYHFRREFFNILKNYDTYVMRLYNARSNQTHNEDFFIKSPLKSIEDFDVRKYKNEIIIFVSAKTSLEEFLKGLTLD